jgi:hypothetical protein
MAATTPPAAAAERDGRALAPAVGPAAGLAASAALIDLAGFLSRSAQASRSDKAFNAAHMRSGRGITRASA